MIDQARLLPDTPDLLILRAVSLGPVYGYTVLLRIEQNSGRTPFIEQGTLYPTLFRLVGKGLLKPSWGTSGNNRLAKSYELMRAIHKRLRLETQAWNRLAAIATALGAKPEGA